MCLQVETVKMCLKKRGSAIVTWCWCLCNKRLVGGNLVGNTQACLARLDPHPVVITAPAFVCLWLSRRKTDSKTLFFVLPQWEKKPFFKAIKSKPGFRHFESLWKEKKKDKVQTWLIILWFVRVWTKLFFTSLNQMHVFTLISFCASLTLCSLA